MSTKNQRFWRFSCPIFLAGLFRSQKVRDIIIDQALVAFLYQCLPLLPCWEAFFTFTGLCRFIQFVRIRYILSVLSNYFVTLFCGQTGQVVRKMWRFFVDIDNLKKDPYTKGKVFIFTFSTIPYWTAEGIWFPKTGFRKHTAEKHLWFWSRSA